MSLSKPHRKPRFKDWLVNVLDNEMCSEDARWKDRARRTAIIRWPHKSRGTWSLEKDANLFKSWAITSGKYQPNVDVPNPKSWKCNFRMNLNICKNIKELKHERIAKGPNACRVFEFQDQRTPSQQYPYQDCAQNHGYLTQERPRYLTSYPPAGMRLTAEHVHNGTIRHDLQGNNPILSGVNSAGRFLYSDTGEIPTELFDDIYSIPPQPLNPVRCSGTSMSSLEQEQDQPLNIQAPSNSFEPVEQDSLGLQIDSFPANELNQMADQLEKLSDFSKIHM